MYLDSVKIVKNTGKGGKVALVIPSGMTGAQFKKWKERNADALQMAKDEAVSDCSDKECDRFVQG